MLGSFLLPYADPTERWIAYGVVLDDDRDGVPDRRYGMDFLRMWRTDLHTGRTQLWESGSFDGEVFDYTPPSDLGGTATFRFGANTGGDSTTGMSLDDRPLDVWASLIQATIKP